MLHSRTKVLPRLFSIFMIFAGTSAFASSMPDLIVRRDMLEKEHYLKDEMFSASDCDVVESNGEVTPGTHTVLRFTVGTANVGTAPIAIGNPYNFYDPSADPLTQLFEFSPCHGHLHFRHYARYELLPLFADGSLGSPIFAAKRGFCMLDTDRNPKSLGSALVTRKTYNNCSSNQGISAGWTDTYRYYLQGQYFVVDGLHGNFVIRITVNPAFTQVSNIELCPYQDAQGFCHMLPESNYSNNIVNYNVFIP